MMFGGWFDIEFMYNDSSFGFLHGENDPSERFSVTSKKFTIFILLSMTIFKLSFLNDAMMSSLILSILGPDVDLNIAHPSSLYKPMSPMSNLCQTN